jgi:ketosteroid isomerase-like protein
VRASDVVEGSAVSPAELPAAIREYFAALNSEDWSRMEGAWADEAELRAVGSRPRHGREEIMAYFHGVFDPWAAHVDRPTRAIVAGDAAVVEVTFSGTTHAGRDLVFDAVDVFDLAGDAIVRLTTWYDLAWVRKQLS